MDTIEKAVREVIPKTVEECFGKHTVQVKNDMTKLWSHTLYGDDFPEYDPEIGKNKADRIAKASATESSPPKSLFGAVRFAVQHQKNDEKNQDVRRKTVVIYKAPEVVEPDFDKRKEQDNKTWTD